MKLPEYFRPIMWSWKFDEIDIAAMQATITMQALNYGELRHWKWVAETFGIQAIKKIFNKNKKTNMEKHNADLVSLLFHFN